MSFAKKERKKSKKVLSEIQTPLFTPFYFFHQIYKSDPNLILRPLDYKIDTLNSVCPKLNLQASTLLSISSHLRTTPNTQSRRPNPGAMSLSFLVCTTAAAAPGAIPRTQLLNTGNAVAPASGLTLSSRSTTWLNHSPSIVQVSHFSFHEHSHYKQPLRTALNTLGICCFCLLLGLVWWFCF